MNECICCAWDGRGYSCCGFECPEHPLNGQCPFQDPVIFMQCPTKTHENVLCVEHGDD